MKQAIVFSSRTGNTRMLAQAAQEYLADSCIYCGDVSDEALQAEVLYVGFWTDKGECDSTIAAFLSKLENKKVFLFGTAGFGVSPAYFAQILQRTAAHLPASAQQVGSYMCQGKMPQSVRDRYVQMKESGKAPANIDLLIENFDMALAHPNGDDLAGMRDAMAKAAL